MYILREYQQEAHDRSIDFIKSKSRKRPILDLPTGSGKSIIIAAITKSSPDDVILVLQPSLELLEQNYKSYMETIKDHPDLEPATLFSASVGVKQKSRVTFATIGSIHTKTDLFDDVTIVLIDECHLVSPKQDKYDKETGLLKTKGSMYMNFLNTINVNAKVIGLSATPYRLKSYTDNFSGERYSQINLLPRERPHYFNDFLYCVPISQMYREGHLAPLKFIAMKWNGDFLEYNSTGADYTEKSVKDAMKRNEITERIPGMVKQAFEKGRKSCLVFVYSVDEARQLAAETPFSNYIHAKTKKKERAEIIRRFKNGDIKTLYNVSVLTTGFDYPRLDTIIIARPTMSLSLYVQMAGRGSRKHPEKDYCVIVDMCDNLKRFGKLDEIETVYDEKHGWVLRNKERILSGVRLASLDN